MTSRHELAQVIAEKTIHITQYDVLVRAIAAYLVSENQVSHIDSIMRDVLKFRAEQGYVEATIVSAFPLSTTERTAALAVLKDEYPGAKHYTLNQKIEENVVGGVRMEMAGEELDLTVRAKLNTLKRLTAARNA